jgi:hypothetical protein
MRRPMSRSISPNKRSPLDTPEPSSPATSTLSRNQIAENLGSKSPDWFKQTQDRGIGSAALRKNQDDDVAAAEPIFGKRQLPGMARDSKSSFESNSPPRADSGRGSVRSSANTPITGAMDEPARQVKSHLPQLDSQKFALPSPPSEQDGEDDAASGRALAMSPTQGRISPVRTERPASPTKGMGGFVQSAMLKRSDSVNKRWSTQAPQGLTRQNSTLSNRGSVALSSYGTLSKPDARTSTLSRDNSMEPSSRPGSSSSNLTITKDAVDKEEHEFVKPALPYHSRSKSVASTFSPTKKPQDEPLEETSPPSPSKRWSPTKSSWLESALKKPESPKPMLPPPAQPAWMAEINRAKQQRGSVDLGKDSPFHSPQVDSPGSGRTSPFKEVQLRPASLRRAESPIKDQAPSFRRPESPLKDDLRGFRRPESPKKEESSGFSRPESLKKEESAGFRRPESPKKEDLADLYKSKSPEATEPSILPRHDLKEEASAETLQPLTKPKPILSPKPSTIATQQIDELLPSKDSRETVTEAPAQSDSKPSLSTSRFSKESPLPAAPSAKAKPDVPPTKDFRGTLRSRHGPPGTADAPKKDSANELANVFGRLKKTETKNYVAPDILKDNILRGKQGLALTGGPKPTVRRDEFRDSIVTKKAAMLAKAEEVGSAAHKRADSSSDPPPTPEAIAKRKMLGGRSDSISNPSPAKEQEAPPEAISRQKSLRLSKQVSPEKPAEPMTSTFATKEPPKSSKFADRFNPALAGLLARGPPAPSANSSSSGGASTESAARSSQEEKKGPAPELTHITKGRARGPKRRAPAAKQAVAESDNTLQKVAPAAAVPLVKAEHILPSNEVSKTDITPEERPVIRTSTRDSFKAKPATPVKPSVEPPIIRSASRESFKAKIATPIKSPVEPSTLRSASRESFKAKVATPTKTPVEPSIIRSASRESFKAQPPTPVRSSVELPTIRSASRESFKAKIATPAKTSDETPMTQTPSRESVKARLGGPSSLADESPIIRTLSRETVKSKPATPSRLSEESPAAKASARESLTPKPATPAKSPELSRRLDKSPSPELPRKPISLELNRKASSDITAPLRKPTNPEVAELPNPTSPSPKLSVFRSSKPLPTPPTKSSVQAEQTPALKEIAPPNPVVPPKDDVPSPEKSGFSVRSASALWSRQSAPSPTPTKPKSPIKLPTRADEQALMESAGLARSPEPVEAVQVKPQTQKPKPKPVGLGLGSFGSFGGLVAARARASSPSEQKALPATPPATGDIRPQSVPYKASPILPKTDDLFENFFDEPPVTTGELPANINSIEILQNPPLDLGPNGKIRTLRKQIQEITGDGKLSAVPVQEEHVLYQDSMYICTHVFGDSKGARTTEVYLWSGNGVAEATLEDAQLFGRNIAKQSQGKLIMLRQGKETPNFFEALGGIVLTRRGSRPATKEYMLCGRRHLGHITFDEVDFSPKSLCSGFAYIISTEAGRLGKIFLWKGRGCSQEEVSGARLMGMDLTMTGELMEIDEGSEPPELFAALPPNEASIASNGKIPPIPRSADHWRYKATSEKYRARLFKIEQQQGSFGWGQGLQVSSFFPPLLRRPSWGMFATTGEKPTEPPQTPTTPKSPLPPVTTKVVEIMPFCQHDLEPEYIYVLDAFFDIYM